MNEMNNLIQFYENEHIFITGGTGFVGKLLISKLLLSCPQIKKILLLIRKKNGTNADKRMEKLFDDKVFESLKKTFPTFYEKVEIIEGDIEKKQLGLTQMDKFFITQNVTVIFHCAANVEFDNDLKKEVVTNVCSTVEIINLVKCVRNLKAFVYVSSSYSNCHLPVVEEKFYEPYIHYKTLIKLVDMPLSKKNEKRILGEVFNTYFFTKAAAEQVIMEEGKGLPVSIFRPSAIISTYKDPISGWTDKAFAPTAVMKAIALGHCSAFTCEDNFIFNVIPGDYTVNALIAVARDTNNRYKDNRLPEPRIFNYVTTYKNPLYLYTFYTSILNQVAKKPPMDSIWFPDLSLHKTKIGYKLGSLMRPWVLTYLLYFWHLILGHKNTRRILKGCYSYENIVDLLDSLIQKPHIYFNNNVEELWKGMDKTDRERFPFDVNDIDWDNYLKLYYDGILKYVIKEKNRNDQDAHKHYFK